MFLIGRATLPQPGRRRCKDSTAAFAHATDEVPGTRPSGGISTSTDPGHCANMRSTDNCIDMYPPTRQVAAGHSEGHRAGEDEDRGLEKHDFTRVCIKADAPPEVAGWGRASAGAARFVACVLMPPSRLAAMRRRGSASPTNQRSCPSASGSASPTNQWLSCARVYRRGAAETR